MADSRFVCLVMVCSVSSVQERDGVLGTYTKGSSRPAYRGTVHLTAEVLRRWGSP